MLLAYSFDIFDTCLVRKCGSSDNIFRIWADRALGEVDRSYLKDLINSRLSAEKTARRNSGKEDVSLDDIYRNLSLESFPNLSIPALKRLELEVERENLSPVRQVLDLIRDYRKKRKADIVHIGYVFAFRFPEVPIAEVWLLGRGGSYICIRRDRLNKAFREFIPVYSKGREDIEMLMEACRG